MDYLYFLTNASLTLRVVKYLQQMHQLPVNFLSVIHLAEGWVMRVKMSSPLTAQLSKDFQACLQELGTSYCGSLHVRLALWSLEAGEPPISVTRRYKVTVVSHGSPDSTEIEAYRQQFTQGLGYCPKTLA